jgi:hypothetical protein
MHLRKRDKESHAHADHEIIACRADQRAAGVVAKPGEGRSGFDDVAQRAVLEPPDAQAAVQAAADQELVAGVRSDAQDRAVVCVPSAGPVFSPEPNQPLAFQRLKGLESDCNQPLAYQQLKGLEALSMHQNLKMHEELMHLE